MATHMQFLKSVEAVGGEVRTHAVSTRVCDVTAEQQGDGVPTVTEVVSLGRACILADKFD